MSLQSQVVWITGASSGLGRALAHQFAKSGAKIILSARREEQLRTVQAECERPAEHLILPLDVAEPGTFQLATDQVLERFGKIDLLVNNAGISQRGAAVDTALAVDRRIMDVNFFGPVELTRTVLPSMLSQHSGRIVVISSLLGKFGVAYRSSYSASKHAVHGFFDSLRLELHDSGVKVTIACLGFIQTDLSLHALTPDGTPQGVMDQVQEQGLPPAYCAAKILSAIERDQREVCIAGKEKFGLYLQRFAPSLFHRILLKTRLK